MSILVASRSATFLHEALKNHVTLTVVVGWHVRPAARPTEARGVEDLHVHPVVAVAIQTDDYGSQLLAVSTVIPGVGSLTVQIPVVDLTEDKAVGFLRSHSARVY